MSFLESLPEGPIRRILRERGFYGGRYEYQIALPEGVTEDQAIDVIARSSWAKGMAEGVVNVLGLTGTARSEAVEKWARHVATNVVRGTTSATARRRGRRR